MTRVRRGLAAAAAVLGGVAGIASLAGVRADDFDRPLPVLADADRLSALELAAWLRARRADLTILDVRPDSAAFAEFHLPRARHVPLTRLRARMPDSAGTVVVYGDGGDLAARAWLVLRTLGHDTVRVMPDGVGDWLTAVLNATLPADATPDERAAFAAQAELSRYFGGLPRVLAPGERGSRATGAALLQSTLRRGCAF
jgi:rhodanese-related sulfurtransferase